MLITTSNKNIKIKYRKNTLICPLNSISYTFNDNSEGVSLYRDNELIATSAIHDIRVNGTLLSFDNMDTILDSLFIS